MGLANQIVASLGILSIIYIIWSLRDNLDLAYRGIVNFLIASSIFFTGLIFAVSWFGGKITYFEHNTIILTIESIAWIFVIHYFYKENIKPIMKELSEV